MSKASSTDSGSVVGGKKTKTKKQQTEASRKPGGRHVCREAVAKCTAWHRRIMG